MIPDDWLWQQGDLFRDFCQWDYDPPVPPAAGTLRQAAVLWHSLTLIPDGHRLRAMFDAIRCRWGAFHTVWGVKSGPQGLSWELYFYDYDRTGRRLGLAALAECLPGMFDPAIYDADAWPWFMASVEFDTEALRTGRIGTVDLYFEAEGGAISAGRSCIWDGQRRTDKNDYRFYRSRADRVQVLQDLASIAPLPGFAAPGRYDEEIFVISRKRASNAAYFSRVGAGATLRFARDTGFHPAITDFIDRNTSALAPYLFDTGIDFRDGTLLRAAIYGVF